MAGYWPQSNTQVCDTATGLPLVGAKLYFYAGGTSTPLTVYTTTALSVAHTYPIVADANGMWPAVFFTEVDGASYRARSTKPNGNALFDVTAPIIWQPPAQPEEPTIDVTALCPLGAVIGRWTSDIPTGWLPCNGRTMGSASSGAQLNSDDYEDLFLLLWSDGNLTVSSGRGVSAAVDWAAAKTITLPDMRGRTGVGDDQMGAASSAGRIGSASLGASGGAATVALTTAQLAAHTHTGTTASNGDHAHSGGGQIIATGSGGAGPGNIVNLVDTGTTGAHTHTFTTDSNGDGEAHSNLQPYITLYYIIKY